MNPVCLDGSLPGYHLHRGYGSGANSWVVNLEVISQIYKLEIINSEFASENLVL